MRCPSRSVRSGTRLLDWSGSALSALWFAVRKPAVEKPCENRSCERRAAACGRARSGCCPLRLAI
nr:hypothetical protein [Burkholderia sp. 9779_493]